ncbi:MAG TPA: hypothetical protein VN698_08995 [Bacteroidia bacterium]|nr:hypothetical protein [Bacteroidia bacterium]
MKNTFNFSLIKKTTLLLSVLFFCLISQSVSAQKKKLKDYLILGSSSLVSGMLDGTIESISYHYDNGFKRRFKNVNDQFWNPSISWTNKYKNNDPCLGPKFTGSTNIFVCTTDAYHMLRTTKRAVDGFTLAYYVNKTYSDKTTPKGKKWKGIAKDFLIITAIRCVGFSLTYSLLFRPQGAVM